ncbi:hypothetical protein BDW75DRAFT_197572 [Aspergillus navahoensis]
MFGPRGSLAVTPVVIGLVLLFWAAPGVIADEGFCDYNNPNEPIGIDLGHQYISASYANSSSIFTPLALVQNAEYTSLISQLAAEHFDRANLKRLYGDRDGSASGMLKVIMSHYASKLTARIPYIDHPHAELIISTTRRVYTSLSTQIRRLVATVLQQEQPESLTLSEVAETFTRVFQDIKASALADTGTKITFAVIGIPDFFNETLANIVVDASRRANIQTLHALPRTLLTHFENPAIREGASVLVLHHGAHHCGIRMYHDAGSRKSSRPRYAKNKKPPARDLYLSLEPWRSQVIYRRLTEAVIQSSPEMKLQVELGADVNVLLARVVEARLLLKNRDPAVVYLWTESRSADFYTTIGDDPENEHLEEVPLALEDWWVYGRNPGVTLTKKMVNDADEEYVKSFAKTISMFVQATQATEDQTIRPQVVDHVAILTDWVDGDLVRRAAKEALGDEILILGGSLRNITMAADGAARIALVRRQNLLIMRGEQSFLGHEEL